MDITFNVVLKENFEEYTLVVYIYDGLHFIIERWIFFYNYPMTQVTIRIIILYIPNRVTYVVKIFKADKLIRN